MCSSLFLILSYLVGTVRCVTSSNIFLSLSILPTGQIVKSECIVVSTINILKLCGLLSFHQNVPVMDIQKNLVKCIPQPKVLKSIPISAGIIKSMLDGPYKMTSNVIHSIAVLVVESL